MSSPCGRGGIRAVAIGSPCARGGIRAMVVRSTCGQGGIRAVVMRSPCGQGGIRAVAMRSPCAPKGNTCDGHAFNVRPEGKYVRWPCVQRAPRRGNEPPAQGKRAKRSDTLGCVPRRQRYAPGGGKSSDRGDVGWRLLPGVAGVRRVAGFMPVIGGVYARDWRGLCPLVA